MTLQSKIERDLNAGPSTVSALSDRLAVGTTAIDTVLQRMHNEDAVRCYPICGGLLTVWTLNNKIPTSHPKEYGN